MSTTVAPTSATAASAAAAAAAKAPTATAAATAAAGLSSSDVDDRIHWALTHGIGMGTKTAPFNHAPLTLWPYRYPASQFKKAQALAPVFNVLVEKIARNPAWLVATLRPTAASDDFVRRLLDIHAAVLKEGVRQPLSLAVNRSDYMLHSRKGDTRSLLQVEINTIASSFGSLSTRIAQMHQAFGALEQATHPVRVPPNPALDDIAGGIAAAHRAYLTQTGRATADDSTVAVVMVVQPGERNFADQRLLQFHLWEQHRVRVLRVTLADMQERGRLHAPAWYNGFGAFSAAPTGAKDHELLIDGYAVSVVYFRAGYSPDDHPTEKEWAARLLIERSLAIKCPTIAYHLAGCKKVQQALAAPGEVEKFIASPKHCDALRSVFAGLYSLDAPAGTPEADALVALRKKVVAANGLNYVMKPQREGGGNNFYGADVAKALQSMTPEEQSAYILMERILPPSQNAQLLREGQFTQMQCLCELGVYGIFLCDSRDAGAPLDTMEQATTPTYINKYGGYLLRVKSASSDEGGVAAGYAFLSSPDLS